MPSRNIKSKQLKKRVKNYRPTPAKFLWPELSFSIVYFKNMKKNKISQKSVGEATISYSNFKIAPTPSRALRTRFRRYALLVPPHHQQSPLHFFPLSNALYINTSNIEPASAKYITYILVPVRVDHYVGI